MSNNPVVPEVAADRNWKQQWEAAKRRRQSLMRMSPGELAIYNATIAVEKMGADRRLTEAIVLLAEAREKVADFIDGFQ